MLYARGSSEDWDRLASTSGDPGWEWNNIQEFIFKASVSQLDRITPAECLSPIKNEQHVPAWNNRSNVGEFDPRVHGHGPLKSSLTASPSGLDYRVLNTTAELPDEFPFNLDLNSGNGLGVGEQSIQAPLNSGSYSSPGWIQTTVGDSVHISSATAFLHPALSRTNLDLLLHTQVTSLTATGNDKKTLNGVQVAQEKTGLSVSCRTRQVSDRPI